MGMVRAGRKIGVVILAFPLFQAPVFLPGGPPQDRPLRHDAAAVVKLVSVRVLGPDGRSIGNLKKEDFALFEDGQRKTITEFEVHTVTAMGTAVSPALPTAAKAAISKNEGARRKIFFFFDLQASDTEGKAKAKRAALRFLETQVRAGDEAAVLGFYSMSGFFIREYLTTNKDAVRRAIETATETRPSAGETAVIPRDDVFKIGERESRDLEAPTGDGLTEPSNAFFVPGTALFQKNDFVERMRDAAEIFKTIPGNKSLVLFTSRNMGPQAERLGKVFGETGTAVFAVNTQDWDVNSFGTKFHHLWRDHPLKDLSAASGGAYFADINDDAGIARDVQDLTGNFYVLGYYIKESWEGKYHKIRVEVARPQARVLVQDGYSDPKPFAQMTDFEKEAQLIDLIWSERPTSSPLTVPVDILSVRDGKTARAFVLAEFEVGAKTDPSAAKVELIALLRDETGTALCSRKWEIDLARYNGRILCPYFISSIPPGSLDLRMVIRNSRTGEALIGRVRVDGASCPKEGIRLFSPLLLEGGTDASFLRLAGVPEKKARPPKWGFSDFIG